MAIEVANAPQNVKDKYVEILKFGVEQFAVDDAVDILAEGYKINRILAPKFTQDMLHIALATVANVDIVVSWM